MRSKPGTIRLPRVKVNSVESYHSCACCHRKLELVTSTLGTITAGFGTHKDENILVIDGPDETSFTTVTQVDTKHFPISKKVRVCPSCVTKLDTIIPEWDKGNTKSAIRERFYSSRKQPRTSSLTGKDWRF